MFKKISSFLSGLILVLFSVSIVAATTYTFQPIPADLYDLDHYDYYTWGIDFSMGDIDTDIIISASLTFHNIENNDPFVDNIMYVHLLDNGDIPAIGVTHFTDSQADGDAFEGQGILFQPTYSDTNGWPTEDFTYDFTGDQITSLMAYMSDGAASGTFGFGFDPDCHFYNDGVTLKITSEVPEPNSLALIFFGLFGLAAVGIKRKGY